MIIALENGYKSILCFLLPVPLATGNVYQNLIFSSPLCISMWKHYLGCFPFSDTMFSEMLSPL